MAWICLIENCNGEKIIGTFYEKELQKTNHKEFNIGKKIREKVINYMANGRVTIILLTVGLIQKT